MFHDELAGVLRNLPEDDVLPHVRADSGLAGMDNIIHKVNTIQKSDEKQDSD